MSGNDEDLAGILARATTDKGWTQTELARRTGIPLATINAWMTRRRSGPADAGKLAALAGVLGVPQDELFAAAQRATPGNASGERERAMVDRYRLLPEAEQRVVEDLVEALGRRPRR